MPDERQDERDQRRRAFGQFVRDLREQLRWTRQKLSDVTAGRLSTRVIRSIEDGTCAELADHLKELSSGFGLSEIERLQFYARAAGYTYPSNMQKSNIVNIKSWLGGIHYPAAARSPLYDFLAFNECHALLFGYDDTKINLLRDGGIGANLLRVLFEPEFEARKYLGEDRWETQAHGTIGAFRALSFRFRDTKRYQAIVDGLLQQPHLEFGRFWHAVDPILGARNPRAWHSGPFVKVRDPNADFEEDIDFISLRVSQILLGASVDVTVYVPFESSVERYDLLYQSVKKTKNNLINVYTFKEYPLE